MSIPPPEGPRARSGRDPRWIYAAFAAALAVSFAGLQRLVDAREAAAGRAHQAAVRQAAETPGTPVPDPTLPAGVVAVDLVPISPDLDLVEPATLRAGARRSTWAPEAAARFEGIPEGRAVPVQVSGPYAAESASLTAPGGSRGARIAVRAVPVMPPRPRWVQPGITPEKRLEIDLGQVGRVEILWKQGDVVIAEIALPRAPGDPALALEVQREWRQQRSHFDPADRKRDEAVVRIGPGTSFDEIRWAVEALLSPRRTMSVGGAPRLVPAFDVEVEASP